MRFCHNLFATQTLAVSPQLQQELEEQGIERVTLWQKAVSSTKFHPTHYSPTMRQRMIHGNNKQQVAVPRVGDKVLLAHSPVNEENDGFVVLYVGRFAHEKNLKLLKPIISQLNTTANPKRKTKLCFVGTGPLRQELQEYFSTDDCPVTFLGELHDEELSQVFSSADVFVMPSKTETLGLVVLESMASGVPVVAANSGGIPYIIKNGTNSFLIDDADDDAAVEEKNISRNKTIC